MSNSDRYMIDPPEGHRFGFPKLAPENLNYENVDEVIHWLKANGYPKALIHSYGEWFRYRVLTVANEEDETHYTIVAEAGTYRLEKSTTGVYRVWDGDKIVQENLTADDALRHAYHIMHGAFHLGNKLLRG